MGRTREVVLQAWRDELTPHASWRAYERYIKVRVEYGQDMKGGGSGRRDVGDLDIQVYSALFRSDWREFCTLSNLLGRGFMRNSDMELCGAGDIECEWTGNTHGGELILCTVAHTFEDNRRGGGVRGGGGLNNILTDRTHYKRQRDDMKNNKLPVIISKDLSKDEKASLINVLKSRKQAIAWKLSDIQGIDPEFCSHKILLEDDYEPSVQHQRRVNPKIHDVIKKEVEKLLDAGLIYPISDSPWVSPVHCVPKKGGMTVVKNEENELVPTRLVTGWRVCIDYRKLNEATCKDHFPLPFMDQMLERLAGNEFYCFLDGFSGYFQILIDPKDQEKTTFTCPYGTFAYRRHKISRKGIEVDKAKVDVISKLPHPTTVKGIRRPLTRLQLDVLRLVSYGKACHLPVELEHKAYWALKHANFDLKTAGDHRKLQLNELSELRDQAYENSLIYKEKTKKLHDSKIKNRIFNVGDQVLLFNSRLKIFSGKLKSRWSGPFTITEVYPYGTAKLSHADGSNFKVNCHRLKHYYGGDTPPLVIPDLQTFPKDN
ncbi:hypothetical protein Tco_1182711 [Tanacetum coccineum]